VALNGGNSRKKKEGMRKKKERKGRGTHARGLKKGVNMRTQEHLNPAVVFTYNSKKDGWTAMRGKEGKKKKGEEERRKRKKEMGDEQEIVGNNVA